MGTLTPIRSVPRPSPFVSVQRPLPSTYASARPPVSSPSPQLFQSRDIRHRFGQRLRHLRQQRNMTQLSLAVEFGIDRTFISDVERGEKSISLRLLEVLALGFRISLSDLLRDL